MAEQDASHLEVLAEAEALAGRGMWLANAGELQRALPLLRTAVARAEPLVAGDPVAEVRVGVIRNDLGLVLAWLGRPAEAVGPISAAVAGYRRQLGVADSGRVRLLLANSLDSLATRLASLGRYADAVRAAEEAVTQHRAGGAGPLELARVLNNLSIRHADTEQHEQALAASREAVELFRSVPVAGEEHLTGLTHATSNLALRLARLGHHAEVPALADETRRLVGVLPEPHPKSQLAALAQSLAWLSWYLLRRGELRRSRAVARTAKELRRRLAS